MIDNLRMECATKDIINPTALVIGYWHQINKSKEPIDLVLTSFNIIFNSDVDFRPKAVFQFD